MITPTMVIMLRTLATMLMTVVLLGACVGTPSSLRSPGFTRQDDVPVIDRTNVVVLVRSVQAADSLIINAARGNYQLLEKSRLDGLGLFLLDFKRPPGISDATAIGDMQRMEPSAIAGLDHLYTLQKTQEMPQAPVKRVGAPRLYAQTMVEWPDKGCRAHTAIGMIDGRVDISALKVASDTIVVRDFSRGSAKDVEHGSAIADLLVGRGRLIGAHLYSASVISDVSENINGAGVPELIRALDWMQQSGVSVVNISLAGPYNKLLDSAIQKATSKGMMIIAAVGNDGPQANPQYPAAFDNVIAVTAIDSAREVYADAVRGDHVDFSAPGVDVFVTYGADGKYLSGTSVAAPFVTALVASNASLANAENIETVRKIIEQETVDLGRAGRDPVYGAGLIRAKQTCSS